MNKQLTIDGITVTKAGDTLVDFVDASGVRYDNVNLAAIKYKGWFHQDGVFSAEVIDNKVTTINWWNHKEYL